jgi:nucleotide-binding universal stress UspA family protein
MAVPQGPSIGSPILIPFDGSVNAEVVFPYLPILVNSDRQVIILQVVPAAKAITNPLGGEMLSPADVQRLSDEAARADLTRGTQAIRTLVPEAQIDQVVEIGEPAERIGHVVEARQVRTILLASQGYSATGPGGFGSIVGRVVRTSPVPVVVIRSDPPTSEPKAIARFVIAHDGSDRADRALLMIRGLARRLATPLHVVTVVEDEESLLPAGVAATLDPQLREEAQADALNLARRNVEEIGAKLLRDGQAATWRILTGPAAPAILAECVAGDVLVVTSHGRNESRWTLGSVAEKLVREATVPVILLRTPVGSQALPAD